MTSATPVDETSHYIQVRDLRPMMVSRSVDLRCVTQFEVDDTCVLRDKPNLIGTVLRSYHTLSSHEPVEDCLIIAHTQVPDWAIQRFISSGAPPKGFVFVRWIRDECGHSLVAEDDVRILNRSHNIGDHVKRYGTEAMVGTVTNVSESYVLEPICRQMSEPSKPVHTIFDMAAEAGDPQDGGSTVELTRNVTIHSPLQLLSDIPDEELKRADDYDDGDYVLYQDWVGIIQDLEVEVCLLLGNNSVVMVECVRTLSFSVITSFC